MRRRGTTTTRGPGARGRVAAVAGLGARGRVAAVAGLAGLAVGLAGLGACDGGPDPAPSVTLTPVESPSPEPTPTPTPTPVDPAAVPPERPAAMDTVDTAGAKAVATYFMQLFPYIFATGDLESYRALSHPECIFCADVIRGAEEQHAAGGRSQGGLMEVASATALEVDPGKWWAVSMDILQHASVDFDGAGDVVAEVPEKTFHLEMAVVVEGGLWQVRAIEYERIDP